MSYQVEFPDYGALDVELPEGFEDQSWHNDASPCFYNRALGACLYIDYTDPTLRENPEADRFTLYRQEPNTDCDSSTWGEALCFNNWQNVLAAIAAR